MVYMDAGSSTLALNSRKVTARPYFLMAPNVKMRGPIAHFSEGSCLAKARRDAGTTIPSHVSGIRIFVAPLICG
jgi:hypothetical protein